MKNRYIVLAALLMAFLFFLNIHPAKKQMIGSVDGYYFEKETFTRTNFPIEIVLVQNHEEMKKYFLENTKTSVVSKEINAEDVASFSVIRRKENLCTLYIIDPKVSYHPEYVGHELTHCIYGFWHSEPQVPIYVN